MSDAELAALSERCGGAPLWVFLMINLAPKPQKLTEIRVHRYLEAAAFAMNRTKSPEHHVWVPVAWAGPFREVRDAVFIFEQWEHRTRGPGPRIVQGVYLTETYGASMNFGLCVVPFSRDEMLAVLADGLARRSARVAWRRGRRANPAGDSVRGRSDATNSAPPESSEGESVKLTEFYRRYEAVFA
jgi:hypothetical protein